MKNIVKCYKDFFGYFNALKTHCDLLPDIKYFLAAALEFFIPGWCIISADILLTF